jgi:hypothetical protein
MSFTYRQATGQLIGSAFGAQGYSGNGKGLNNPMMQTVHGVGPLPRGQYTIEEPHVDEKLGPIAMRLIPHPDNEMYGRGDFFIHGDNSQMNHTASEGCIVLNHESRVAVATAVLAGDNQLTVTA